MSRRPKWWLVFLAKIWPITWLSAKATKLPVIGPVFAASVLPLFSKKNLHISYIPINEPIGDPVSTPLPVMIVEDLLHRSPHRVIIDRCTCRDAKQCSNHPVTMGCTLIGEGAKEIDPRIARHVSVEEAIDHLHDALKSGLMPMMGRVKLDNLIWGVRDRGKLLTICYCCRCCCTILQSGRYLPDKAAASIVPLEGVDIIAYPDKCKVCGACEKECFVGAIHMDGKIVVRNMTLCKHCGRCATVCPHGAIQISLKNPKATMDSLMKRIDSIVNYE